MKTCKRLLTMLLAITLVVGSMLTMSVDASAKTKTTTKTYNAKLGVFYDTAMRMYSHYGTAHNNTFFLENEGDYVASVKSSSKNLIVKTSFAGMLKNEGSSYYVDEFKKMYPDLKDKKFHSRFEFDMFAKKGGTYTVTVTINNKAKKKVGTVKFKVVACDYPYAITSAKFGNKYVYSGDYSSDNVMSAASGKFKVTMNKTFKLKSIEVGTANGKDIVYKKIKNGAKITLAKTTQYTEAGYSYHYENGSGYVSDEQEYDNYDYLKPATFIRVTYYDTLLKVDNTEEYIIYKK